MAVAKKNAINLFRLCVTLSAIQLYCKINRDEDLVSSRYGNDWVHESRNYDVERYTQLKMLNNNNDIVCNSGTNPTSKYSQGHPIWKTLIDDLVRFDRNKNYFNLTIYPFDIKKEDNQSPNSLLSTNASNLLISYQRNYGNSELDNIGTFNWNPLKGFGTETENNSSSDIFIKDRLLDNSFFDLHLNTAVNASAKLNKKPSPLKKDPFLENLNENSVDELSLYSANLTGVHTELKEQAFEMADVLYKQDVDLGYMLSLNKTSCKTPSSTQLERNEEAEQVEAIQSLKDSKLAAILYQQDIDLGYISSAMNPNGATILNDMPTLENVSNSTADHKMLKTNDITVDGLSDNASDGWAGIPFKIDNETGEYIRLPLDDLLQDILPFDDTSSNNVNNTAKSESFSKSDSEERISTTLLDVSSSDLSLIMQSFWTPSQDEKCGANIIHDNSCRQGICNITDQEAKSTSHSSSGKMDSRIQDITNIFAPVTGFYGINPDITSYTHYHAHYPHKTNPNTLPYASRQHSLHNPHREDGSFQTNFAHNLESSGSLGLNTSYLNAELQCIKNFTGTPGDLVPNESFLSSFLNEECIQMMDISANERSPRCNQGTIVPVDHSNAGTPQIADKSIDTNNSLCGNSLTERLDLSCDSAVSSLGSERVPSTSDGEWGEGSDSGQDYHQSNYYGPYDYSSSSRNFPTRQMPAAQKKYHMFGKRYFQEQIPENSIIHSTMQFLHSTNSVVECDGIENIIDNSPFDDCSEEMLPLSNAKHTGKTAHLNTKSDRDKFVGNETRPQINHENQIRHNHTYTLLNNSSSNSRFNQDSSECKDILPDGHLTRDEKRARNLNVPIPVQEIINLPMDEFNERISKYDLTENQLSLIRDIRRRGKNKVAAQNCRKRKLDQILSLEGEVKEVRRRKDKLHSDRAFIAGEKKRIANKFATLHQHIFHFLRDAEGNPCSPSKYSLQQASDGSIYLLPRDSSKLEPNYHMSILIEGSETSTSDTCRQRRIHHGYAQKKLSESPSSTPDQSRINVEHQDD